jgi:hypothetical protein
MPRGRAGGQGEADRGSLDIRAAPLHVDEVRGWMRRMNVMCVIHMCVGEGPNGIALVSRQSEV